MPGGKLGNKEARRAEPQRGPRPEGEGRPRAGGAGEGQGGVLAGRPACARSWDWWGTLSTANFTRALAFALKFPLPAVPMFCLVFGR